jgi:hypothetical protein
MNLTLISKINCGGSKGLSIKLETYEVYTCKLNSVKLHVCLNKNRKNVLL